METQTEIIDFYRPKHNMNKNLYVKNIVLSGCACSVEEIVLGQLHEVFSRYGCVFDVQVFPSTYLKKQIMESNKQTDMDKKACSLCRNNELLNHQYYAFVKFFSRMMAEKAKRSLHMTNFIGSEVCRVDFATRKKLPHPEESVLLHATRCRELANFYLGFNGWSSQLTMLGEGFSEPSAEDREWSCEVVYQAQLDLVRSGQTTSGIGVCQESTANTCVQAKMQTKAVCHKRAVDLALQNAFSKVLLVLVQVGGGGGYRVVPEVDTTQAEVTHELLDPEEVNVAIGELTEEPRDEESDGEGHHDLTSAIDQGNVDILQQLEQQA